MVGARVVGELVGTSTNIDGPKLGRSEGKVDGASEGT